ncbi:hypothetical protein PQR07_39055 [Paraburkholderia aspalathi]
MASPMSGETPLEVRTSWIGNTHGFGDGTWVQNNITAIAIAPDGRVFTNSPWDESGAEVSVYLNGKVVAVAASTHGWGNSGGNAVALNRRYLFVAVTVGNEHGHLVDPQRWPPAGRQWYGVSRRYVDDPQNGAIYKDSKPDPLSKIAASFLMINEVPEGTSADIDGLAADDTSLYVANTTCNRIQIYDTGSMQHKATWGVHEPGRIALVGDGTLWVITGTLTGDKPRIMHYTVTGKLLDDTLPLTDDAVPVDVAMSPQGCLAVADDGWRQQIVYFEKGDSGYKAVGGFGDPGGIFGGNIGQPGVRRFNGLTGIGFDRQGNVYVSCNGVGRHHPRIGAGLGSTLEGYAPDGRLLWQVQGLLFVDGAWMDPDPARPDSVYTGNKRFELDLSKPPGEDWTYVGYLSNRFRYPHDPVFNSDMWPGMPMARYLDGHTFLYLTDMGADHLKIYRFNAQTDGECAIPSGFIAGRPEPVQTMPNVPEGGQWIWRDRNGNGAFDNDEFILNNTGILMAGGWGWWVDTRGDIWRTSANRGIHRFHYCGLDGVGNPTYSYADMTTYREPIGFTQLQRSMYEPATDVLYVTGYTANAPVVPGSFNKEVGRVLACYDGWTGGAPTQRYAVALPWNTQAKPLLTLISVTVEGDYLFAVEPVGKVHVFDKNTGTGVGVMGPGPEVGHASGWVDVPFGISAHRRADGAYLVFVEEDARGKVLMYRWLP